MVSCAFAYSSARDKSRAQENLVAGMETHLFVLFSCSRFSPFLPSLQLRWSRVVIVKYEKWRLACIDLAEKFEKLE